jgi:hypothetical protein
VWFQRRQPPGFDEKIMETAAEGMEQIVNAGGSIETTAAQAVSEAVQQP